MSEISYNGNSLELRTSLLGHNLSFGPDAEENTQKLRQLISTAGLDHLWKLQAILNDPRNSTDLERLLALTSELGINEHKDQSKTSSLMSSQLNKSSQVSKSSRSLELNSIPPHLELGKTITLKKMEAPVANAQVVKIATEQKSGIFLYCQDYFVAKKENATWKALEDFDSVILKQAFFQVSWVENPLFLYERFPEIVRFLDWNIKFVELGMRNLYLQELYLLEIKDACSDLYTLLCCFEEKTATSKMLIYGKWNFSHVENLDMSISESLRNKGISYSSIDISSAPSSMLKDSQIEKSRSLFLWPPSKSISKDLFLAKIKNTERSLKAIFFFDSENNAIVIGREKDNKVADLNSEEVACLPEGVLFSSRERKKLIPVSLLHSTLTSRLSPCNTISP